MLKTQDMQQVRAYFQAFAKAHGTTVCEEDDEEDLGTVLSFADKDVVALSVLCDRRSVWNYLSPVYEG